MDAQLVWNTWRRVLTSDELVEWVLSPDSRAGDPDGLTPDELAVLRDFADTPAATAQNIGMYRRGLARNVLGALDLVPLTRRLLQASGLDLDAVATECARVTGYVDNGPHFWRTAADLLAYLVRLPDFGSRARQDVLAIDAATVALARRLGGSAPPVWPDSAAAAFSAGGSDGRHESVRYVANPAAVAVSTSCDLSGWIVNPFNFDAVEELEHSPRHWLIYFPAAEAAHEYAQLSERAARAFDLLRTPRTVAELSQALDGLPAADVLAVIDSLSGLGVVGREADLLSRSDQAALTGPREQPRVPAGSGLADRLPNDAFVLLDPAVQVLDTEIDGHRLLSHGYFEAGMVVPPGDGLLEFVTALSQQPVNLGALRARFDDQEIIDTMLASLRQHGFLHVTPQTMPSADDLARLRGVAGQARGQTLRRSVVLDLDDRLSMQELRDQVSTEGSAPEVLLLCARLADHGRTFAELARLRQAGTVRMHHTVVRTGELSGDRELSDSLNRLGASVVLEGVPWPTPDHPIPGLDELTRGCVAVHALMTPGLSILDDSVRSRALAWAGSVFVSGLCFRLEAEALWPAGDAGEDDFIAVFDAVQAVENEFGDASIVNLPSDEVLLGNTMPSSDSHQLSAFADSFRTSYLRWRIPLLKSTENDNSWSQVPEVEDKLVRSSEDLLPTHPELLLLRPGSVVVDVCGGLGRVARRLSPAVGDDGLVISVEMFRCLSDRARRFACERGFTNLHFRPGLAQRIPLPDATADAAVNEWTGAIWELGLGPTLIREMARVVRPGGRIAVTHRLVQLRLASLGQPWVQYDEIYAWIRESFAHPDLTIIAERVWGQIVPSLVGENATRWRKQYMPRLINPFDITYKYDENPDTCADVYLTVIAQRQ